MINHISRFALIGAGVLALSACATTTTGPSEPASKDAMPMTMEHGEHKAMMPESSGKMKAMPSECKAMMAKMHEKMQSGDMDMAAMKAKMKSGEGMSETQKKCHKMMHDKMHKSDDQKGHKPMMSESSGQMKDMPPECKAMKAKMHEKMQSGDMDMAAMKAKMKSGEGMSETQKKCHKMMHDKMHKDAEAQNEAADEAAPSAHNH